MKHWIQAARVRTLPLSVSGIILGTFYAIIDAVSLLNILLTV